MTDIWRTAIVRAPMARIMAGGGFEGLEIRWLPPGRPFTFLADPFGVWRDGHLFMFAETFDYRNRLGGIDVLTFDASLRAIARTPALREQWHLSYPAIVEDKGETYMLPEAHRSGGLTLYRAAAFPDRWEPVAKIELDSPPVDATPMFFDGLWWLFYSPSTTKRDKVSRLHLAFAEHLAGPWRNHPSNPVRVDRSSARPGGTPIVVDGCIVAPMQDCTNTYGGGVRPLRITRLTTATFEAEPGDAISAPASFAPFDEGLHTLSACGDVTLIDAKRIDRSVNGLTIAARRHLHRLFTASSFPAA